MVKENLENKGKSKRGQKESGQINTPRSNSNPAPPPSPIPMHQHTSLLFPTIPKKAKEGGKKRQKRYPTSLRSCSRINGVYCFNCGYRKIGLYQVFERAAHFSLGAGVIVVIWKIRVVTFQFSHQGS